MVTKKTREPIDRCAIHVFIKVNIGKALVKIGCIFVLAAVIICGVMGSTTVLFFCLFVAAISICRVSFSRLFCCYRFGCCYFLLFHEFFMLLVWSESWNYEMNGNKTEQKNHSQHKFCRTHIFRLECLLIFNTRISRLTPEFSINSNTEEKTSPWIFFLNWKRKLVSEGTAVLASGAHENVFVILCILCAC